jgi:hypothetical protein
LSSVDAFHRRLIVVLPLAVATRLPGTLGGAESTVAGADTFT